VSPSDISINVDTDTDLKATFANNMRISLCLEVTLVNTGYTSTLRTCFFIHKFLCERRPLAPCWIQCYL